MRRGSRGPLPFHWTNMAYINTRDKTQKNVWRHQTIDGEIVRHRLTDKERDHLESTVDTRDVKWTEEK